MKSQRERLLETRKNPNDECYTPANFAAEVVQTYAEHLRGKTIFCPCDDPRWSGFAKYLIENFFALELRGLVCACYYPRPDGNMEQLTAIFHPERSRGVFAADPSPKHAYLTRAVVERNRTPEEKAFRVEVAKNVKFPTATFGSAQKNLMVSLVETVEDITGPTQGSLKDEYGTAIAEDDKKDFKKAALKGAFEWTPTTKELLDLTDVVVTNPPFSKVIGKGKEKGNGLLEVLDKRNKNFILIGNYTSSLVHVNLARQDRLCYLDDPRTVDFIRPDGGTLGVGVTVYSSFKVSHPARPIGRHRRTFDQVINNGEAVIFNASQISKNAILDGDLVLNNKEVQQNGILYVKNIANVPYDYDGPIAVCKTSVTKFSAGCGYKIVGQASLTREDSGFDIAAIIRRLPAETVKEEKIEVANAQTPTHKDKKLGYVYLIYDGRDRIKIGITRRSVGERLRDLTTALPHAAVWDVSPAIEDYALAEELLHEQFKFDNIGGEWFKIEAYPEIKKAFLAITEPCKTRK